MKRNRFDGVLPPQWRLVCLDFETRFDNGIGLGFGKQTNEEYVRDPRFEVLAVSWSVDGAPAQVVGPRGAKQALLDLRLDDRVLLVCHNTAFDAFVLHEHYGIVPTKITDTMALARLVYPNLEGGYSLGALAQSLRLGEKGVDRLRELEGVDIEFLVENPLAERKLLRYCASDTDLTVRLYQHLVSTGRVDDVELSAIDDGVRMTTEPVLVLDEGAVGEYHDEIMAHYETVKHLGKDDVCADAFRALGIEPETKVMKKGEVFAFAKSDDFMKVMLDHDDPKVREVAAGRLTAKSTSERGKAKRFGDIAKRGRLPVAIVPNGAHTGRDAGGGKLNLQNVKRGSVLRDAICAPPGHKLIVSDFSQIEARVLAAAAGEDELVESFRRGEDYYCTLAGAIVGRRVTKADKQERQMGKALALGAGYGLGAKTFVKSAQTFGVTVDLERAKAIIHEYRTTYPEVKKFWYALDDLLPDIMNGGKEVVWHDVGATRFGTSRWRLTLPSGRSLAYPGIHTVEGEYGDEYQYMQLGGKVSFVSRLWGGILTENLIQAAARDAMLEAGVRISRRAAKAKALGHPAGATRLVLRVHDELVYCVPDEAVDVMKRVVVEEMSRPLAWLPTCPMSADMDVGQSWGEGKV